MPLVQTRGAASAQGFGEFAQAAPAANYIEDVFSTYLYTGNGSTQTITNGIDLSGKGGLVWVKTRTTNTGGGSYNNSNILADSVRTPTYILRTNGDEAQDGSPSFSSFNSNGFTLGTSANTNNTGVNSVSWTFREQAKFFDVVTYTGDGANRTIAHNLGSVPGSIWVKRTDTTGAWQVYHRSNANTEYMVLNTTAAVATDAARWNSTTPTSSVFSLGTDSTVNANGGTYVAYIFAHDAGGFGTAGTDNVISCGSFTTDGSGNATVSLGYEPQWVLTQSTSGGTWQIQDSMRGMPVGAQGQRLRTNSAAAEDTANTTQPNATGFSVTGFGASQTFIYIAIRRGPMKTPTSGSDIFVTDAAGANASANDEVFSSTFPVDFHFRKPRSSSANGWFSNSRLIPGSSLSFQSTSTEASLAYVDKYDRMSGIATTNGFNYTDWAGWLFKRAPGFFDQVCYTGTGANQNITHNLGVAPELIICKIRSGSLANWVVWNTTLNSSTGYLYLNDTAAVANFAGVWNGAPTSTYFTLGTNYQNNESGSTLVAYLFATLAGVSKVGSYTGNGGTQAIACGFTGGARFVLIKRTDSTGDWYVYDTARGMTLLTDPYLLLNDTAAEAATLGSVTTTTGGFTVDATILAAINTNAASYIFLAIA